MKQKYALDGVIPSLNTPFDENNDVDFASLGRLIEFHLLQGAVGFLTTAQAAEVFELSLKERIAIVRFVRDQTKGRAQVIAGSTARTEQESIAVAEAAIAAGCEGVLIEVPQRCKGESQKTIAFFEFYAQLGMPMLMIQDLDWSGFGMTTSLISELFELIEPFRCLKVEVNPAGPKYSAALDATNNRLHVSGGWASLQMIEALDRGVSAFLPTSLTGIFAQVMHYYRSGDREAAKLWFHQALPVLAFTRQHLDISIAFHKRLFYLRGIFSTPNVRKHSVPYDSWHREYGDELIKDLREFELELPGGNGHH